MMKNDSTWPIQCVQNGIKEDDTISDSERRSKSSGKKLIHEADALHLLEDLHHETVTHARHLRRSTLIWVLCTVSCFTHGQDWRRLLGAGYFRLAAEWRGGRKQPHWCRTARCRQTQRAKGNRRCRSESVEGPAGAAQRTVRLQAQSWRQRRGHRAQRRWPGPEHPHPEEGHNEVHGGTGIQAMLGGLGLFALLIKAPKQKTTATAFPASHWVVT